MEGTIEGVLVPPEVDSIPTVEVIAPNWLAGRLRAWEVWGLGFGDYLRWDTVFGAMIVACVAFGSVSGLVAPTTAAITPWNSKALYLLACLCVPGGYFVVAWAESRRLAMAVGGEDARRRMLGTLLAVALVTAGSVALVPTRVRETFWVGAVMSALALLPRDVMPRVVVSPLAVALGIAALYMAYLGSASVAPMAVAAAIFVPTCGIFAWVLVENGLDRLALSARGWQVAGAVGIGVVGWFAMMPYTRGATEALVLGWYAVAVGMMLALDVHRTQRPRVRVMAYGSFAIGIVLEHAAAYPATIFPAGVGVACLYFLLEVAFHQGPSPEWVRRPWVHGSIIGVATLACINTLLPWDPFHYSFFLFPARDLIAGKSVLADINAQYGVGIVYLTALLTGWSLSLANGPFLSAALNVLNLVEYIGLYGFTRLLVRSRRVALLFWIAIVFSRSMQMGGAESFPSTGPMRFGLGYLAIFVATSEWFARRPSWRLAVEALLFGVGFVFSVEGLVSVAAMQLAADAVALLAPRGDVRPKPGAILLHRLNAWVAGALVVIGLLTMDIARRTGALPDVRHYTDFVFQYGGGFGFYPPELWSPWAAVFLLSAGGAVVAVARLMRSDAPTDSDRLRVTCGFLVGAYGVLQFTYFVFRPHPNNLYHVMWPSTIMALWLLDQAVTGRVAMGVPVRAAVVSTLVVVGAMLASRTVTSPRPWLGGSGIDRVMQLARDGGRGAWFNYDGQMRLDVDGTQVRGFLAKHATGMTRFPMLLHDEIWQRAIAGTPYVNTFAISFEPQDSLIALGTTMAVESAKRLPIGSILLVEHDLSRLGPVHLAVIRALCDRGSIETVERGNHVDVMRLISSREAGGNTTCRDAGSAKAVRG